jgi:hypothetical protein
MAHEPSASPDARPEGDPDAIDRGVSEFGELLAELLVSTPGAYGAVLSDGVDDVIDTAHRPAEISALDVCIAGAQVGQAMARLNISTIIFGLGRAQVIIEAGDKVLISEVLWREYLLTLILHSRANIARAMRDFDEIGARVLALLR